MPKFILREDKLKESSPVEVELRSRGTMGVSIVLHHKEVCNTIGSFTEDGSLHLNVLNCDWARESGIQMDMDNRIKIA